MSAQRDVVVALRQPPPGKLVYSEFLEWCDEDTRGEKFVEYEAAGVREYWLIPFPGEHLCFGLPG